MRADNYVSIGELKQIAIKTEDEYGILVKELLAYEGITFHDITGIIISSVVPPIMFALERMCEKNILS
ncbi:hypothetical protein GCM10020331_018590 [Ectobacillus funiculus]